MPQSIHPDRLHELMRSRGESAGRRVAELRKAKDIGPTLFSALTGLPLQTIHKIEHGQIVPRDHVKAAIAVALDVDIADIWPWPTTAELVDTVTTADGAKRRNGVAA